MSGHAAAHATMANASTTQLDSQRPRRNPSLPSGPMFLSHHRPKLNQRLWLFQLFLEGVAAPRTYRRPADVRLPLSNDDTSVAHLIERDCLEHNNPDPFVSMLAGHLPPHHALARRLQSAGSLRCRGHHGDRKQP